MFGFFFFNNKKKCSKKSGGYHTISNYEIILKTVIYSILKNVQKTSTVSQTQAACTETIFGR